MKLNAEEQSMLDGEYGEPVKQAIEYQIRVGKYFNAKRFVPVTQAHITADIEVMGDLGLNFLKGLTNKAGKFTVPTTSNARCIEFDEGSTLGQKEEMIAKERKVIDTVKDLGAMTIDTCINYQVASQPHINEHIAWGDTGTVIYANSIFGSRTNFESGPAVISAALTGRVPEYGFHLEENRKGSIVFDVQAELNDLADWGILGRIIGAKVFDYNQVPVITNVATFNPDSDDLKHLGASMATWSLAMFHVVGVTPEAPTLEAATGGKELEVITITEEDMTNEYKSFEYTDPHAGVIVLSGPQLSLNEIAKVAKLLEGKKIAKGTTLIITTPASTYTQAEQSGFVNTIRQAGGIFLRGVCFYILDGLTDIRKKNQWSTLVTNSVKLANNVKAHRFIPVVRTTEDCIDIAVKGSLE
ncbi:aconitase X [Pseudogracilibacillus auburnensis]|uniref:Putative aconitase subunit 1 n=1 Tax=Pseudogracilibacillus auburnensis TaxID=1494959 RepID=A0A2V3VRB1_9BACI|nr:aconitase X catalytic domain-containing protein [Pseudogracilibacillus auburnensis]MBO1001853.1 aconitase X catalytic domain-containing protein [Pseudogracilibacillus auburnensis]PXW83361.1 putative aconitase subunit 1 [Pseudogracilibacillus auburnensis]